MSKSMRLLNDIDVSWLRGQGHTYFCSPIEFQPDAWDHIHSEEYPYTMAMVSRN
jgi:hypothetical protein